VSNDIGFSGIFEHGLEPHPPDAEVRMIPIVLLDEATFGMIPQPCGLPVRIF
jgi:hypothetical protein